MSIVPVQRLTEAERPALLEHFLGLPTVDRCLRFGGAVAPRVIAAYVHRLNFGRDAVFGVHDPRLALAGAMHVAVQGDEAELGVSVLPAYRRRGIGAALFRRALEHARNRSIAKLTMQCLSANVAIVRMAQKFELELVSTGVETRALLGLPVPSIGSVVGERVSDTLAVCDGAVRAFVAGWRHRHGTAVAER